MSGPGADHSARGSATGFVGRAMRRSEDPPLVSGQGRFTADLPTRAWVRFVRSPLASGRIVRILRPPNARVFVAADLGAVKPIRPLLHRFNYVPIGQPVLALDRVRFVGEPIAAVVGSSAAEAEDVADQVTVEIDPSASVVDARAALAEDAPRVHDEAACNVVVEGHLRTPGFEHARAAASRLVGADLRSHRQNALPLEARAAHAAFDSASGRLTLTLSTQMPHLMRTAICDAIGIKEALLRVIAPDVGGGFGQKMSLPPEYVVIAWLARELRQSLAWVEDRRENLMACYHSRDQYITLEGAFDDEARLLALSAEVIANVGAYSCFPTTCGVEPLMAMAEMLGPYDIGEYACRARGIATNTCPMAPYRGVSRPTITLAIERLFDKAAAAFGIDPVEIRRRNLISNFPYRSATGLTFDDASYVETMEQAVTAIDVPGFRVRQQAARRNGRHLGLGLATFSERTGYGTPAFAARGMEIVPGWERVEIGMDPSGCVELRIGASPHGQGLRTTLAQIVADEVGVTPDQVRVIHGDTDHTPYGFGTFASRSLVIAGGATLLASRKLRSKLIKMASQVMEAAGHDIVIEAGVARIIGTDRVLEVEALARSAYHQIHRYDGNVEPGLWESATYDPPGTFSNACHVAIVEVDIETGAVFVEQYLVAEDAGRLINPMIAEGQIHGGVAQGIANALYEEIVYDDSGNILTTSLADYLVPTLREIPTIEIHHRETLTGASLTRAKGLGEGGAIGAPAAIVNAINDALSPFGVAIEEIPATPRRIRAALREAMSRSLRRQNPDR
jgi:aerobic carbon-monoxide dehydrogenase large subunit